jgi:hypothetical protein
MNGDPLRHVRPGEKIPADTWNIFCDVARIVRGQTMNGGATPEPAQAQSRGIVHIKNTSGADLNRFAVLGISGIVFTPTDNEEGFKRDPLLTGITPTADHAEKFVILQEPAKQNIIVPAVVSGVTICKVDIGDADHAYATIKASDATQLESADGGLARILYKEAGTGTKWAIVCLGGGGGSSLPPGTGLHKCLMLVDDLDPGAVDWDFPRFP